MIVTDLTACDLNSSTFIKNSCSSCSCRIIGKSNACCHGKFRTGCYMDQRTCHLCFTFNGTINRECSGSFRNISLCHVKDTVYLEKIAGIAVRTLNFGILIFSDNCNSFICRNCNSVCKGNRSTDNNLCKI